MLAFVVGGAVRWKETGFVTGKSLREGKRSEAICRRKSRFVLQLPEEDVKGTSGSKEPRLRSLDGRASDSAQILEIAKGHEKERVAEITADQEPSEKDPGDSAAEWELGLDDFVLKNQSLLKDSSEDVPEEDLGTTTQTGKQKKNKKKNKLPVVAILGRPNVGKSTLFNRLTGDFHNGAIVENVVGITRDRTYSWAFWDGYEFQVVDTGGLVFDDNSTFLPDIRAQALLALREAAVAILCVDARAGVNPLDQQLAEFLRRQCRVPVVVAANKAETIEVDLQAMEFWGLGLGEVVPLSAIHGSGTGHLLDAVVKHIPKVTNPETDDDVINVAIVGRPNVGKSSLLNVLTHKERAIVSEVPGTTRDAIDESIVRGDQVYNMIDTAGIRRRTAVSYGTEFFMINRAFKAIRRAHVVLLVVDMEEGATEQDRKIAERIEEEGKACIILANKWDLIEKDNRSYRKYVDSVRERLMVIQWAKLELVSALKQQRTSKVLDYVDEAVAQYRRRVSTSTVNEVLREAVEWHKPASTRQGKQGRIYYCTQVASRPPTIALFVNSPGLFGQSYRRYMERQFREALGFEGSPLRIVYRGKPKARGR